MKTQIIFSSMLSRLSVALVLSALSFNLPALAGLTNEPDPTTGANVSGAQMGIRYWIELRRHGQIKYVTNQQNFVSGDQIKFHVQPTVDGFAYIVLRSGSQGEQAVLFPLERSKDNNKLHQKVDYALPADDWLTFDAHPGTEKVSLIFSKSPIDGQKVIAATTGSANHVVIKANSGSKDLIPAHTTVVYQQNAELPNAPTESDPPTPPSTPAVTPAATSSTTPPATNSSTTASASTSSPSTVVSETLFGKPDAKPESKPQQQATAPEVKTESKIERKTEDKIEKKSDLVSQAAIGEKSPSGTVLVRQDDSEKVLHIDVDLNHSGS